MTTHKVKYDIVQFTRGNGLELGCGGEKSFPHFLHVGTADEKAQVVVEDVFAISEAVNDASCNFIVSHVVLDKDNYDRALQSWWAALEPDGHLVIHHPVGVMTPGRVRTAMMRIAKEGVDTVLSVDGRGDGNFLCVFQKRTDGKRLHTALRDRPKKTACVVRYGGFGDQIQASNILPELKRQGYHVTFMTTPKGQNILQHDPHIDAWLIQDHDQVPNPELYAYWQARRGSFDKWVNLSESVEGSLLALVGRANHMWPDNMRRRHLNINYLEFTAELAELPYLSEAKFYPSEEEVNTAADYIRRIKLKRLENPVIGATTPRVFSIMWVLAGSSIHKFYPHQDQVIARVLLEMPEAQFILSGDMACQILEAGWENETRISRESGNMEIRDTLTLAQQVDCVVGQETGVLNAVAFEDNTKVVLLSHSSPENLTKHWKNTATLTPDTGCYPCHRLHYGRDHCFEDESTGAALCQTSIQASAVFDAIKAAYKAWGVR